MNLVQTQKDAEQTDYDYFSIEAIDTCMKLHQEYGDNFTKEELMNLEYQYHLIRTLDEETLYERVKHLGFKLENMEMLKNMVVEFDKREEK